MNDDSTKPAELADQVKEFAHNANSAINGFSDAVGLTAQVAKNPYGTVAAALGVGYVVGGGLFTPTTARLLRLGMKLASVPQVQNKILDIAEAALDQILAQKKQA